MNILAFADLHAQKASIDEIRKKSKQADVIVAAGDLSLFGHHLEEVMIFLASLAKPVLVIHGNHETEEEIVTRTTGQVHFLHGLSWVYNDVLFLGWGGGGFSLRDEEFEKKASTPFLIASKQYKTVVFVTHQPPYGTKIDFIYGHHAGNKSFRAFIKQAQPTVAISGHLHETAKKKDILGKTVLVNPGHNGMILTV